MKRRSSVSKGIRIDANELPPVSAAEIARVKAMPDSSIDYTDIPQIKRSEFVAGRWGRPHRACRVRISIEVDADVASRVQAAGPARVNQVLRRALVNNRRRKAG